MQEVPLLKLRQQIKELHSALLSELRNSISPGIKQLPEPFTAHVRINGHVVSMSVQGLLQDHGVHLMGLRIPSGEKVLARDDQLDCETLIDVLVRAQSNAPIPDGSSLTGDAYEEGDDVGKLMKSIVGIQKYFIRVEHQDEVMIWGPQQGGDRVGVSLGELDRKKASFRLDGHTDWRPLKIQF